MPTVSLIATLAATLAGFALGASWYGPLFGKTWFAENGFTAEHIAKDFNPAKTYGTTFVLGLIAAYVFGWFIGPKPAPGYAIGAGLAVGLCWVATAIGTNYLFERRSLTLFAVNGGYHVLRFGLTGAVFALLS